MRWLHTGLCWLGLCIPAWSQTSALNPVVQGIQTTSQAVQQTYTDAQLRTAGLNDADISAYRERLGTIKGQWWGHVSPIEFMMYSSENQVERKRFAKLYLSANFSKALAERDAMADMYAAAREIYAEQMGADAQPIAKRPALFIDITCEDCKASVHDLIETSDRIMDIYLTQLSAVLSIEEKSKHMIAWARSLALDPNTITLNDDNGMYQRKMGHPLERFHLITP